jgi:hypothetical protein
VNPFRPCGRKGFVACYTFCIAASTAMGSKCGRAMMPWWDIYFKENRMNLLMPCTDAHPAPGKEVMAMDDVDVNVSRESVNSTSNLEERMSRDG